VHLVHVAVATADGTLVAAVGDPDRQVYARSAVKPVQAAASLDALPGWVGELDVEALAIAAASHAGSADQQVEAARVLALAGLDEEALGCPPALPVDEAARSAAPAPTRLAHNCSGKHALFLLAHTAAGGDPTDYLDPAVDLQRRVRRRLAVLAGCEPGGPSVDGCGAPAWRLPLRALAAVFARLATPAGDAPLAAVRAAMIARPDLVGGPGAPDTELMSADARTVAKRGAEGVLAAGVAGGAHGRPPAVGVAVKVADGAARGAGPAVATVCAALGATVPDEVRTPAVLGGGTARGSTAVAAADATRLVDALAPLLANV
jgi:L-asparaginase II